MQSRLFVGILPSCILVLIVSVPAPAQTSLERIHSFGFMDRLGDTGKAALTEAGDGLYGTTLAGGPKHAGAVFRLRKDGPGYVTLHQFEGAPVDGADPTAEVLIGSDGALYGTTYYGGAADAGTLFKLNRDGTGYTVLLSLDGASQGANVQAGLIEAGDGRLYGAARYGGAAGLGTLFRLNKNGTGFEVIHEFLGGNGDGSGPIARLLQGSDGALYGATWGGGSANAGAIFKINRDGTGFALLHSLVPARDGQTCRGALIETSDHLLYGTTSAGGSFTKGTLFSLPISGLNFTVVLHFGGSGDGQSPYAGVIQGSDGSLYGTTFTGGDHMNGALYKLSSNGSGYTNLHHFQGPYEGYRSESGLLLAADGALYGTTSKGGFEGLGAIYRVSPNGGGYGLVWSFTQCGGDGMVPQAMVVQASDGALYGVSDLGGSHDTGIAFKLNPDGSGYSLLHDFNWEGTDGYNPYSAFIEGTNGALYGTTGYGGAADRGTVFRMNKDGSGYAILHSFSAEPGAGAYPSSRLLRASDGMVYGRTTAGGAGDAPTVFRLNDDGSNFAIVYSLPGIGDWVYGPDPDLIEGPDGALYSTAFSSGANGQGMVWKVNKDGSGYRELHSFSSTAPEGRHPDGGLLLGSDGFLYGTTRAGGQSDDGTVFKVLPDGTGYAIIHEFNSADADGYSPRGNLLEAGGGMLLGTTYGGGTNDNGVVFALAKDGATYAVLHRFDGVEGSTPLAGLGRGVDGSLYGTTYYGGDLGLGTIFRMPAFKLGGYLGSGGFHLTISGSAGQVYAVDASDTLPAIWRQIGLATNIAGTAELTDSVSSTTQRCYRARWLLP